ncbi:MAG TPA: MFS transporter [Terriglobia bacterium]|nr:MFS transporter [Terriglobia bacterium]
MPPTRARYTLLRLAFALSIVTYVDRVCISTAATDIRQELGLRPDQMGWVFSAFVFAYAIFEIPSGWLGDVFGPRKILARIVLWWSAFTVATGLVWSYGTMLAARFLFGAGEAGAFPNVSRSLSRWFPERERGTAHGVIFMGSRLGGAITPLVVGPIIAFAGWRQAFWLFGILGVVWCVFWWRWFRDDPANHPGVNAEELGWIRSDGAPREIHLSARVFLNWNLLWIGLMYFCFGYCLYFYLTWLPTYLKDGRGFSSARMNTIHTIVLLAAAATSMLGGRITDYLTKRHGLKVGRSVGAVSMPLSGAALATAALTDSGTVAAIALIVAAAAGDLSLSASWAMCHDVGSEAAGSVTAYMNTFGNLGGALSPIVVGQAVAWWGSWSIPLLIAAGVAFLGGVFTLLVDSRKQLRLPQRPFETARTASSA